MTFGIEAILHAYCDGLLSMVLFSAVLWLFSWSYGTKKTIATLVCIGRDYTFIFQEGASSSRHQIDAGAAATSHPYWHAHIFVSRRIVVVVVFSDSGISVKVRISNAIHQLTGYLQISFSVVKESAIIQRRTSYYY